MNPLKVEEFTILLNKFLSKYSISVAPCQGVAVSGGVDSMAICFLLKQYFGDRIHAFTIDHQLRKESSVEAQEVGKVLHRLNVKHTTLKIDWEQHGYSEGIPKSQHLETAARKARYALLGEACQQAQCKTIYFGHHLGDLKETTLFRLARASGIDGLAGISPLARFPFTDKIPALDLLVARPLLGIPKTRLVDTCRYYGIKWFDDPSNGDLIYQRNMIRHVLKKVDVSVAKAKETSTHSPLEALTDSSLETFAAHMRRHREFINLKVSNIMENMVKFDNKNGICTFTIDDKSNWLESTPLATRVLSKMIHTIGSKDHSPRLEQVLSLREEITEFRRSARRKSVALGGTLITSPKSGSSDWTVSRQPPKRNELWKLNKELRWDAPNLWDDRIFVALQGSPSTKLFIRPLNNTDREQVQDIDDFHRRMRQWFSKVPESSRFTIPSVVDSQDNLVAIPTLDINLDPKLVQFTVIHRNSRDFS